MARGQRRVRLEHSAVVTQINRTIIGPTQWQASLMANVAVSVQLNKPNVGK